MSAAEIPAIPVTVIGGYLGAGKTTLVNHLLRAAAGRRLAVLVNEFGELPIDADLIEAESDDLISIAGGCVCCTYGSDLMAALLELPQRVAPPDHVLVEASGVALPGAIAASVGLLPAYRLDGVIVLADAETVAEQAADTYLGDTIGRQLADADLVVLNKIDVAPPERLESARALIRALAATARTVEAARAAVPLEVLLGVLLGGSTRASAPGAHHHPDAAYLSWSVALPPGCDPRRLGPALGDPTLGVLRAKGFVVGPHGGLVALHVVGRRWHIEPAPPGVAGAERLVLIGRRGAVDPPAVARSIQAAQPGSEAVNR